MVFRNLDVAPAPNGCPAPGAAVESGPRPEGIAPEGAYPIPGAMIRRPPPSSAILFVAGVAVLFTTGGGALQLLLGEAGIVAAEWLLLFLPAVLFLRAGGFAPGPSLSLRAPGRAGVAAALLMILGATPVAWWIGWAQTLVLPVPPAVVEAMQEMLAWRSPGRLAWLLLAVAVTPAVCEEVVFRGVLLGGTRHLAPWRTVLLNGVVFGAFHLSLATPIRFLPTAWLGIVLAWVVLRTGSLWTGILMHVVNNGAIVLLAAAPVSRRLVTDPQSPPPLWLLGVAVVALAAGARILARLPDVPGEPAHPAPTKQVSEGP